MFNILVILISIFTFFVSFFFIRLMFGILVKDMFYKYFIIDSLIYSLYFGIVGFFSCFTIINTCSINNLIPRGGDKLLSSILFIPIIPVIYNAIKGYFIVKKHPKLKNEYYPAVEFIVIIFGLGVGTLISMFILLVLGLI